MAANPSLFLRFPAELVCPSSGVAVGAGQSPLAFNADGSLNTCQNPAAPGSSITIYMNGLGLATPGLATGAVATSATPLNISITGTPNVNITATLVPGSIDAVWQARIPLPVSSGTYATLMLSTSGVPFREQQAVIWTKPGKQ